MIYFIIGLIIGLIIGYFTSLFLMKKYIKTNLINEKFVKSLFMSMGKTPSEKQIKQILNQINKKV